MSATVLSFQQAGGEGYRKLSFKVLFPPTLFKLNLGFHKLIGRVKSCRKRIQPKYGMGWLGVGESHKGSPQRALHTDPPWAPPQGGWQGSTHTHGRGRLGVGAVGVQLVGYRSPHKGTRGTGFQLRFQTRPLSTEASRQQRDRASSDQALRGT